MSERLQYRFAYRLDRRVWGIPVLIDKLRREHRRIDKGTIQNEIDKLKRKALREFFRSKGERSIAGVEIVAEWRNPDRKIAREWRSTLDDGQSLPDFYKTLHGKRGALKQAYVEAFGRGE